MDFSVGMIGETKTCGLYVQKEGREGALRFM